MVWGIGLIVTFLIEFIDNTIKTIDEIERYNKSVIGVIPAIGKISSQGIISRYLETKTFTALGGEKGIKRKLLQEIILNLPSLSLTEVYELIYYFQTQKKLNQFLSQAQDPVKVKLPQSLI